MKIICPTESCTGCMACVNVCSHKAINIVIDVEGFDRPWIDEKLCVDCGLCQKVCPINNHPDASEPLKVYSGWSADEDVRLSSSSGGAFTEIARPILEEGGVVFGCALNENLQAVHTYVENMKELAGRLRGSKYVQSRIEDSYRRVKDFLKEGRKVLFSGTPCQIAGLRNYLRKDYENLITVDLICHGIPSPLIFEDYKKYIKDEQKMEITDVKFRCKKSSWIFFNMTVTGHVEKKTLPFQYIGKYYSDPYIRGFLRNYFLRPSCHHCHFTSTKRCSDFTIADWWGYKKQGKEDKDFACKGVSLLFANTHKAETITTQLRMILKERNLEEAIKTNRCLYAPYSPNVKRTSFWEDYSKLDFDKLIHKYMMPEKISWQKKLKQSVRNTDILIRWISILSIPKRILIKNQEIMKEIIRKYCSWAYRPIMNKVRLHKYDKRMKLAVEKLEKLESADKRIYYMGVAVHVNLGDLAQRYCILSWLEENYPDYKVEMFESDQVVYSKYYFIKKFKHVYRPQDIIVFQSGYTTQDLGGYHNLMHEMVVKAMPDARILMLPQTVFFQIEENKQHTANILNSAQKMLFLARDFVSYETAKQMMPNIKVIAYPDIVTTLIGTLNFNNKRNGVCLCTRNDGEKFYSKEVIDEFERRLVSNGVIVKQKDTQSHSTIEQIRANLQQYIEAEIESYSHFKVTVTDRYHGTIFSLCAGTPVIIIKTTDHKVTTGADWFKGVYDDYIYVADDLDDAFDKTKEIMNKPLDYQLSSYFKVRYYDKLKELFETI